MYGIIVLIAYLVMMVGATMLFTKKETNTMNFCVSDRKMGTLSSAMSIAATWIWAPALFVSAEKAYLNGIIGLVWFVVPNVICLLLFIPFAKKIRERMPNGISLVGYMHNVYKSKKVKNVYLTQLGSLSILSTAVQLLAGGKVLATITHLPFALITIILAIIAYTYSQHSGIKASVLTDGIQMVLILTACVILVPWALSGEGVSDLVSGLGGISGEYSSLFSKKGLEVFFAFGLPTTIGLIAGPFGDQCFWQRAFSINKKKIGSSFRLGAVMFAVVPLSMGILGFISAGQGYIANDSGIVNLELVANIFPKWVMVPFLFMLLSGLLSTIDSNLCAVSSLILDVRKTKDIRESKGSMIILLVVGVLIANIPNLQITHLFLIYSALRATTLLPTVMTLKDVKLSANGIAIGIMLSMVLGVTIFAYGTLQNISAYKTIGILLSLGISGISAYIITKLEVKYGRT